MLNFIKKNYYLIIRNIRMLAANIMVVCPLYLLLNNMLYLFFYIV